MQEQVISRRILFPAVAGLTLVAVAAGVALIPPYVCGWLPEYPMLERVEFYWNPKAQFLRCNSVLHDIAAAKDKYVLEQGVAAIDSPLAAGQIGLSQADLRKQAVRCPAGGWYTINPVGVHPTCSIHGDSLDWQEGQPYPTRGNPAPPSWSAPPAPHALSPEDRIELPPPDEGGEIE